MEEDLGSFKLQDISETEGHEPEEGSFVDGEMPNISSL
jgi:hypothetical protein